MLKIYKDESGWRVGDGENQVAQVFPSEEAAKKYIKRRARSKAAFDRMMKYPGKIIPVEWLKENDTEDTCPRCLSKMPVDAMMCAYCGFTP